MSATMRPPSPLPWGGGARLTFEAAEVTDSESDELEDSSEWEEESEREVVVG